MKKLLLLLTLIPLTSVAQDKKFSITVGAGNNGQIDKMLNDFYFFGHETHYLDDSKIDEAVNLKVNFIAAYRVNENWGLRLKFGYAIRNDEYIDTWPTTYNQINVRQNVIGISPGLFFAKDFDRLQIGTGVELPIYLVQDFTLEQLYQELPDSVNVTMEQKGTVTMNGGAMFGINHFLNISYALTPWLRFGGEINYGLLMANIGDKVSMDYETTIPSPSTFHSEYEKYYKKVFFSAPEVSFGLIFTF